MSEVKKISPVGNIYGWEESQFGEFVLSQDYDALAAEAQALREQNTKFQHMLADITVKHFSDNIKRSTAQKSMDVYLSDGIRLLEEERDRIERNRDMWKGQCERQAEQLAALRARVAVVPDASTVYAALDARERLFTSPENIQVALEAQSRLNGKTVSEGLLRKWLELMEHGDYREGHCMCGSPVDSHGIGDGHAPIDAGEYYAGQVMEELRALLNQDKENGNG
ncbi:TPA: hypothetical protein ACGSTY_006215 [Pseudomonas aeruginosa]